MACVLKHGLVGSGLPGALQMGQWSRNLQLEMEGRRLGGGLSLEAGPRQYQSPHR